MRTSIYQNSYIVLIITFVMFCLIFYVFRIGYSTEIKNEKIVRKFSWKYPLAISLIVWLLWHFVLYPSDKNTITHNKVEYSRNIEIAESSTPKTSKISTQKINMINWN